VAATEPGKESCPAAQAEVAPGAANPSFSALMSAALTLPILVIPAKAGALENAEIGYRLLDYREDGGRMHIREPLIWGKGSLAQYDFAASGTVDIISGASPRFVSNLTGTPVQTLSGASIGDRRRAADAKITRRVENWALSLSRAVSFENDYSSRAFGVEVRADFAQKNTTLLAAFGRSNDRVGSVDDHSLNERRDTKEILVGITQIIDSRSLVQSNVAVTHGHGFYNDPYRFTLTFYPDATPPLSVRDTRPTERHQAAWLTRYRRAFPDWRSALALEYRYYRDDWGIRSHTLDAAWTRNIAEAWKIQPALRYYSQSQADFYRAVLPVPQSGSYSGPTSSDQRLAGFGGLQPSIKVIYTFPGGATFDAAIATYRQRSGWKFGGGGNAEFAPFRADSIVFGVTYPFGS
jgi:hypothetical protein